MGNEETLGGFPVKSVVPALVSFLFSLCSLLYHITGCVYILAHMPSSIYKKTPPVPATFDLLQFADAVTSPSMFLHLTLKFRCIAVAIKTTASSLTSPTDGHLSFREEWINDFWSQEKEGTAHHTTPAVERVKNYISWPPQQRGSKFGLSSHKEWSKKKKLQQQFYLNRRQRKFSRPTQVLSCMYWCNCSFYAKHDKYLDLVYLIAYKPFLIAPLWGLSCHPSYIICSYCTMSVLYLLIYFHVTQT